MFNNLVINDNITGQYVLYKAPGDAVIAVFETAAKGLTRAQILAKGEEIRTAMLAEINRQGPDKVSADPAKRNVIDIGKAPFSAANLGLFRTAVTPRVDKILDETRNNCFHLEVLP
jgi:hypothetical protein